jgi:hypothetical protein
MAIFLSLNLAFVALNDVSSFAYYEKLMLDYIEPPDVLWIRSQETSKTFSNEEEDEDVYSKHPDREELCPTCSTVLITGAEFCTDCGTKVTK